MGIPESAHVDDAQIQQFVNEKLHRKLDFLYQEQMFHNKMVGVLSIPRQKRPFTLRKDYAHLRSNVVYVRRGSSTDEASVEEAIKMDAEDRNKGRPTPKLVIVDSASRDLPDTFERRFLRFEELPDFSFCDPGYGVLSPRANRDYWRDAAEYLRLRSACVEVRVGLNNASPMVLSDGKVELTVRGEQEGPHALLGVNSLPSEPDCDWDRQLLHTVRTTIHPIDRELRFRIDEDGGVPVCHLRFGDLLPGETGWAADDVAFIPDSPGKYTFVFRILAAELPEPVQQERMIDVVGPVEHWTVDQIDLALQ